MGSGFRVQNIGINSCADFWPLLLNSEPALWAQIKVDQRYAIQPHKFMGAIGLFVLLLAAPTFGQGTEGAQIFAPPI